MSLIVETHIIARDSTCSRCKLDLGQLVKFNSRVGDRIGVISGLRYSKPSAYRITKPNYDSNLLCTPLFKK